MVLHLYLIGVNKVLVSKGLTARYLLFTVAYYWINVNMCRLIYWDLFHAFKIGFLSAGAFSSSVKRSWGYLHT